MIIPTDKFGREFKVGDFIVHAISAGDSPHMQLSKVLGFKESKEADYHTKKKWTSIIVWGVEDKYATGPGWKKELALNMAKGYLTVPERAMIISRDVVPAVYLKLLDPVTIDRKNTSWHAEYKKREALEKGDVGHQSVDSENAGA